MKTRRELLVAVLGAAGAAAAERLAGAGLPWPQDPAPSSGLPTLPAGAGAAAHPARWWTPLPESRVACGLCFRGCRISEGARGHCGVRENRGGALKTLVHSRPSALALDPIEKKPFFHVLPGTSALSLGTAGCNFHCLWCQNWEISQARPEEVPASTLTPDEVASLAVRKGAPVVACTYNEPTVFAEYALDVAIASRKKGVRTVVVSNGAIREEPLRDLCAVLAAYKVDLKCFSERTYREQCSGDLKAVLDTLRRLAKMKVWTEIVVLLIPGLNDSEAEVRGLARFVRDEVGPGTPVHFTRFHPTYRLTNLPPTPVATLERARDDRARRGARVRLRRERPGAPGRVDVLPGLQGAAHPARRDGDGREPAGEGRVPRLRPRDPRRLELSAQRTRAAPAAARRTRAAARRPVALIPSAGTRTTPARSAAKAAPRWSAASKSAAALPALSPESRRTRAATGKSEPVAAPARRRRPAWAPSATAGGNAERLASAGRRRAVAAKAAAAARRATRRAGRGEGVREEARRCDPAAPAARPSMNAAVRAPSAP